ncbi:MAG TPA: PHB depolymerase family esterase [Labilithrix sp.]|nr:PHB depolymerase family esterase [Labilithrix sp.]
MNAKAATPLLLAVVVVTAAACGRTTTTSPPIADGQAASADAAPGRTASGKAAPGVLPSSAPLPPLPSVTGAGRFAIPGRAEAAIEVVLPEKRAARPPLLIAFHGTGEEPENIVAGFELVEKAASLGIVVIAPRAGYRDTQHPPDVDHPADWGGSSWNMWTARADANEDLRYVRALIDAAQKSWGADTTRVYTAGFSNGAYFSYFVAASMPDRIAGFAAMSGGWSTDACPSRTDQDGTSLHLMKTTAPAGRDITCASLAADRSFPAKCRVTPANKLHAPRPGARVPFGYLAHYSVDDSVSVVWSCLLAEGLGARARTKIRAREPDGTTGHTVMPNFIDGAFEHFAGRTNAQ